MNPLSGMTTVGKSSNVGPFPWGSPTSRKGLKLHTVLGSTGGGYIQTGTMLFTYGSFSHSPTSWLMVLMSARRLPTSSSSSQLV